MINKVNEIWYSPEIFVFGSTMNEFVYRQFEKISPFTVISNYFGGYFGNALKRYRLDAQPTTDIIRIFDWFGSWQRGPSEEEE